MKSPGGVLFEKDGHHVLIEEFSFGEPFQRDSLFGGADAASSVGGRIG